MRLETGESPELEDHVTEPFHPLQGQVAVVTGAARGIGQAIARRLAQMGCRAALVARDMRRLEEVSAAIESEGGQASAHCCDLTDAEAVAALGREIDRLYGRCDILVNNAAVGMMGMPLVDLPLEDWERTMQTNLRAPYLTVRALAPMMIAARRGHIINISSLAGHNPLPGGTAYCASKWGLNGLTYSLAEELRQFNIRVSVIAPGSVNTGFGQPRGNKDAASPQHPGGGKDRSRMIQASDVAHAVAMLVTQAPNSFISEILLRPTLKP